MRNFHYYLFIFFSLVFSLFFINYHFNQPRVLGVTSADFQKMFDNAPCKDNYDRSTGISTCNDKSGIHHYVCKDDKTAVVSLCNNIGNLGTANTKYGICEDVTNNCPFGTKCVDGSCQNAYNPPFIFSSVYSSDNTWCIDSSTEIGHFCEDQTGKYFSSCQNNVFQGYKCESSNGVKFNDPRGAISIGSTFYFNYGKLPSGIHCVTNEPKICSDNKKCNINYIDRTNADVKIGGCADLTYKPPIIKSQKEYQDSGEDGTTCQVIDNNTSCKDGSGTHYNYCSGSTSVKYFCSGKRNMITNKFKSVKCVTGNFPCTQACSSLGICGVPSKQCKSENAECQINNSEKKCCEGLICSTFNSQSGNGKCSPIKSTSLPTPKPTTTSAPMPISIPDPTPTITFDATPHRGGNPVILNAINWFVTTFHLSN